MTVSETTKKALKDFGLTEYEVKAYIALVEAGPVPASQLTQQQGFHTLRSMKYWEILSERVGWRQSKVGRVSILPNLRPPLLNPPEFEWRIRSSQARAMR